MMTSNREIKRAARELAERTGLPYAAALRSLSEQATTDTHGVDRKMIIEARHSGCCFQCGKQYGSGTRIAPYRGRWGHDRCVGALRPDVRSLLERDARSQSEVELMLAVAAGYEAAHLDTAAERYRSTAEGYIRFYVDPPHPAPREPEEADDVDYDNPWISRAEALLHDVAVGTVTGTALLEAAGRCLQRLDLGSAADDIRSMRIRSAPDGPATPEAICARGALDILHDASRVGCDDDEDWTHCQELITWAGKIAMGRLKPTATMPHEVWESDRSGGGISWWLEI
jgi:hypothetical protein